MLELKYLEGKGHNVILMYMVGMSGVYAGPDSVFLPKTD
jgi:hypothetical protein